MWPDVFIMVRISYSTTTKIHSISGFHGRNSEGNCLRCSVAAYKSTALKKRFIIVMYNELRVNHATVHNAYLKLRR